MSRILGELHNQNDIDTTLKLTATTRMKWKDATFQRELNKMNESFEEIKNNQDKISEELT